MTEEWRPVKGFEKAYEVSNQGKVRSVRRSIIQLRGSKRTWQTVPEKILRQDTDKDGYKKVSLAYYKKRQRSFVHRLVAEAFLQNPDNKPQVNHKDSCRSNNSVENLEWCTASENTRHGYQYGNAIPVHPKRVQQFDLGGNYIKTWETLCDAGRAVGTNPANIRKQIQGKIHHCRGYIWKYDTEGK